MSFPDGLSYRRVQRADLPVLYKFLSEFHLGSWSLPMLEDLLLSSHRCRLLSVDNTAGLVVAGFVEYTVVADECELLNIAVGARVQGRGLGRLLLQKVLQEAKDAGCSQCLLEVRRSNDAAIGLYVSEGFVLSGVRKAYYPAMQPHTVPEDALLYSLQF